MKKRWTETAVRGTTVRVPALMVDGQTMIVTGGLIKIASVPDEAFVEEEVIHDPRGFISKLVESGSRIDILTFAQKVSEATPKHPYLFEWDNAAVASTVTIS